MTDAVSLARRGLLDALEALHEHLEAIEMLRDLFGSSSAEGSLMAGRAEEGVGDPEQVALAASILASDLYTALAQQSA
ncbi:hypothetical protein [Paramicrobacterium fandaimingii]|uniref:hypothetical protein n=1 Tax=Paramicrobacterium fandaimingii TaxID=2708079 RepID=UPI0014203BCD|nr:hypothetical protein [Microbacterium fandaimingii]